MSQQPITIECNYNCPILYTSIDVVSWCEAPCIDRGRAAAAGALWWCARTGPSCSGGGGDPGPVEPHLGPGDGTSYGTVLLALDLDVLEI